MQKYFMIFQFISVVMSGVFGTRASILSDLNLMLQILLLVILLVGFRLGKNKAGGSLKMHGRLMAVLVALNGLSILLVMGPSLFLKFGAAVEEAFVIGFPLTLLHHSIGLIAEILGVVLVFRKFGKVRTWMRITFMLWLIAVLFGIGFYVTYYVV
jgi:uncharacterized membrane protein YozB (DUF420 family)